MFFSFTELILFSSFIFHQFVHLFKQHSRMRQSLTAIYPNGIRIKLQVCNRVRIPELLVVNNIILFANLYNKLLNL